MAAAVQADEKVGYLEKCKIHMLTRTRKHGTKFYFRLTRAYFQFHDNDKVRTGRAPSKPLCNCFCFTAELLQLSGTKWQDAQPMAMLLESCLSVPHTY